MAASIPAEAMVGDAASLSTMSLEELLDVAVYTPTQFPQRLRTAAAAVSVLTRQDIETFGFKTFSEALRAFPGIYITEDRAYDSIGLSGISNPSGDFNGRILVLIDGHRLNDALYDSASIGSDFPVDLALIERIELLRGPSSSVYGNNAVFAVINVITHGEIRNKTTLSGHAGSAKDIGGRAEISKLFANGLTARISASYSSDAGKPLSDLPEDSALIKGPQNDERFNNINLWIAKNGISLTGVLGNRVRQIPLPFSETLINDPLNQYRDQQGYVSLAYNHELSSTISIKSDIYYGFYNYQARLPFDTGLNQDEGHATWFGGSNQLRYAGISDHTLIGGLSYRVSNRLDQTNFDISPRVVYADIQSNLFKVGFYGQDEWQINEKIGLNIGARVDFEEGRKATIAPRTALVYQIGPSNTAKLQYGVAYRQPNTFERFYETSSQIIGNPELQPERLSALDATWEAFITPAFRLQVAGHYVQFKHQITQREMMDNPLERIDDRQSLQFFNRSPVKVLASDMEADYRWDNDVRIGGSLTLQSVENQSGEPPTNSPRNLFKARASTPLKALGLDGVSGLLAMEFFHDGARYTDVSRTSTRNLLNINLSGVEVIHGVTASLGVYNVLATNQPQVIGDLRDIGIFQISERQRQFRFTLQTSF